MRPLLNAYLAITLLTCAGAHSEAQDQQPAKYVSGFTGGLNPPISQRAKQARQESIAEKLRRIAESLERIEGKREEINARFSEAWREEQKKYQTYKGKVWGHLGKGFFTLPPEYQLLHAAAEVQRHEDRWQRNLQALLSLNEFLQLNGVQLFVVMYPAARAVSSRVFLPEFASYPDEMELAIARKLLEHDIEVITFTDRAAAKATEYPFMYFYPTDFHPGEGTQEVAAEVIAEHLERFSPEFVPKLDASDFSRESENNCYTERFTYPAGVDIGDHQPGAIVRVHKTYYRGKPIQFDDGSKLLVCGHSFIQTPAYAAFLSSAIAGRIRYIPHNWQISSVGPYTSIPRRLLVNREKLLRGKRACVMIFDSYFNISTTIEPVDVREVDRRLVAISQKQEYHAFDLNGLGTPSLQADEKLSRFVEATGAEAKGYPIFRIPKPGETLRLEDLTLPDDLRSHQDLWLLVELSLSNKHMLEVVAGGQSVPVEFHQIPTWQELFVKLPPLQENLALEFKAVDEEALFTIRKIALCR